MVAEASKSVLSAMARAVSRLAVRRKTGAMALPVGVPRPVEKTTSWQPPATSPEMEVGSLPGVSMITRPSWALSWSA